MQYDKFPELLLRWLLIAVFSCIGLIVVVNICGCSKKVIKTDTVQQTVPQKPANDQILEIVPPAAKETLKPITLLFDFDSYEILPAYNGILENAAMILKDNPELWLSITGYCDERGTVEYNERLGWARAKAVSDQLKANGAVNRISLVSCGKRNAVSCDNELCWQQDRKVTLNILNN